MVQQADDEFAKMILINFIYEQVDMNYDNIMKDAHMAKTLIKMTHDKYAHVKILTLMYYTVLMPFWQNRLKTSNDYYI